MIALTRPSPGVETGEQVYLQAIDGQWRWLESGTGISCDGPDVRPQLLPACRALGYRT